MTTTNMTDLVNKVNIWAKNNATDDYNYGSRQSYWAAALNRKIINTTEYDLAAAYYGNIWTYRGD